MNYFCKRTSFTSMLKKAHKCLKIEEPSTDIRMEHLSHIRKLPFLGHSSWCTFLRADKDDRVCQWLGDSDVSGLQMAGEEASYCWCQWRIVAKGPMFRLQTSLWSGLCRTPLAAQLKVAFLIHIRV